MSGPFDVEYVQMTATWQQPLDGTYRKSLEEIRFKISQTEAVGIRIEPAKPSEPQIGSGSPCLRPGCGGQLGLGKGKEVNDERIRPLRCRRCGWKHPSPNDVVATPSSCVNRRNRKGGLA